MKDEPGAAAGTKPAESSHSGSVDTVGRVELKATVGKAGFFDLNRALSWLRDNASDVHVEISIDAVAPDEGFDRVESYGMASSNRSKKEARTWRSLWSELVGDLLAAGLHQPPSCALYPASPCRCERPKLPPYSGMKVRPYIAAGLSDLTLFRAVWSR